MKLLFRLFLACPLFLFSMIPEINSLPWIEAKDEDAAYIAKPFLPNSPVILEAGICDATDTEKFKKIWPKSTIYGFEALPSYYIKALKKMHGSSGVKIYNKALYNYTGEIAFYRSINHSGTSSLFPDNLDSVQWPFETPRPPKEELTYGDDPVLLKIPCITVNDWAREENISHVDYIWLDTEGAELFILQEATLILHTVSVISVEINFQEFRKGICQFSELYEFLINQGFVLKYIWGNPNWQAVGLFINPKNLKV